MFKESWVSRSTLTEVFNEIFAPNSFDWKIITWNFLDNLLAAIYKFYKFAVFFHEEMGKCSKSSEKFIFAILIVFAIGAYEIRKRVFRRETKREEGRTFQPLVDVGKGFVVALTFPHSLDCFSLSPNSFFAPIQHVKLIKFSLPSNATSSSIHCGV